MKPIRVVGRKQKLLDFLHSEEGNADRSKVLAAGAVLGGSVLAQMLLASNAHAADACPDIIDCGSDAARDICEDDPACGLSCPQGQTGIGTCYVLP